MFLFFFIIGKRLKDIGYTRDNLHGVILFGVVATLAFLAVCYLIEFIIYNETVQGIIFTAIDPKAGVKGGLWFGAFLLLGNVINCLMEESLFRGVMIPLLRIKYEPWTAILIQAFIFGLWHIPWAFKGLMMGNVETGGVLIIAVLMQFIPTLIGGIAYGAMFYYTNSIWTPWIAHFLINSTVNIVHTTYAAGLDEGLGVRMSLLLILLLLMIPFMVKYTMIRNIDKSLKW